MTEETGWRNRIENKLDRLTEIMATQAEHNERIMQLAKREQRNEERLDDLEKNVYRNTFIAAVGQWLVAAVVGALIGWLFHRF